MSNVVSAKCLLPIVYPAVVLPSNRRQLVQYDHCFFASGVRYGLNLILSPCENRKQVLTVDTSVKMMLTAPQTINAFLFTDCAKISEFY